MAAKIVAAFFFLLGLGGFAYVTGGRTSETALMNGVYVLVPGVLGGVGAIVGRRSLPRAIGLGVALAFGALFALFVFFEQIFPKL